MSKRGADKPLDYDNWDAPDEQPPPSTFEQADEETLKKRKMIFVSKKLQSSTQQKRGIFKSLDAFAAQPTSSIPPFNGTKSKEDSTDSAFLSKLVILNKEVSAWISKNISEDPCCILTPIFKDYEKHLASIKPENAEIQSSNPSTPSTTSSTTTTLVTVPSFSIAQPTVSSKPPGSNGFSFNFKPTTTTASTEVAAPTKPPVFSIGLSPASSSSATSFTPTSNPPLFSFKTDLTKPSTSAETATPFTFSTGPLATSSTTPISNQDPSVGDEEEYVPPKPEVKEIKEEGSVYTIRCKLFYKKSDQWTERGLGNLHIIPSGEEKFQLLVRADTNLGNILLNIMVNKDIPMHLQKNNVVFACIPSPPLPGPVKEAEGSPPRPVPMLIRVKTPEAAAALLSEIDKHRGKGSENVEESSK